MKKLMLSILFLLFSASFCVAQTCDCKIVPYRPDSCFSSCTASIIADSTLEELLIIAKLKKETAQKIVEYSKKNKVQAIEDYKAILKEEFKEFEEKLQSLDENQIAYFQRPIKDRGKDRIELAKLNKAINALANVITVTTIVRDQ